ncbi:hypothetical protein EBU71_06195 [bacterium]|nr:hypothetical protein [Candidatus Elulimicrobium humile]
MAGRKKQSVVVKGNIQEVIEWPKITVGSHSTRTEYEDGRVDFQWNWEKLKKDVNEAISEYERQKLVREAPYHPGYEGAVITKEKPRRTRKK